MIKAVIFDMDGTLVDSEILKARGWKLAFEEQKLENGDKWYERNIGKSGDELVELVKTEFSLDSDLASTIGRRRSEIYYSLLKEGVNLIIPTINLLKSLPKELKIALASSEKLEFINQILRESKIETYFDVITSGEEVAQNKPAPDIYFLTAEKLGLSSSERLVIEDSKSGVIAAKRAGMLCIAYKGEHSGNQNLSRADYIINDLSISSLSGIFKYVLGTIEFLTKKLKSIEAIEKIVEGLRADNKFIVTTNGSFDILHAAHINLLEKAKKEGDVLIVLLNNDLSIKRAKGDRRPIVPEIERAKILAALECVDYLVIFEEDTPIEYLRRIKPNLHVKGGSVIPQKMAEEKALIASWDGDYKQFPLEEGFSTTNIIEKIIDLYS